MLLLGTLIYLSDTFVYFLTRRTMAAWFDRQGAIAYLARLLDQEQGPLLTTNNWQASKRLESVTKNHLVSHHFISYTVIPHA
jgi:hypothetical protein